MARVLIADTTDGFANLERILTPGHELVAANKVKTALQVLKNATFDLIIVGVHFDESRMFELLPQIRTIKNCAKTPVICFCARDTALTRTLHESLDFSVRALGAWMYLDQHEYNIHKDPDAELRRIIERCLTHEARKEILAKRVDLQKQREELHRLGLALEADEWTAELEDKLGDLRRALSKVLLELYHAHLNGAARNQVIDSSRDLKDRVSDAVTASENALTGKERNQWRTETEQSISEQELVEREETKRKKSRQKPDKKPNPERQ